jgi:prophage regulatory protein
MSLEHGPQRGGIRVLRRKQILELFGISSTTLWAWVRMGKFPAPISLGSNTRVWLAAEIDGLLVERAKERDRKREAGAGAE